MCVFLNWFDSLKVCSVLLALINDSIYVFIKVFHAGNRSVAVAAFDYYQTCCVVCLIFHVMFMF